MKIRGFSFIYHFFRAMICWLKGDVKGRIVNRIQYLRDLTNHSEVRIKEMISLYKTSAFPNIKIKIIPTNSIRKNFKIKEEETSLEALRYDYCFKVVQFTAAMICDNSN